MPPADMREAIDQLRRDAHQWKRGIVDLSALYTQSLIRIDEEAHEERQRQKRKGERT